MKNKFVRTAADVGLTILGGIIYAAALAFFLSPNSMAPGGVSGIAIILNHLFPKLSVGVFLIILNIPLIILGIIKLGKRFILFTALATAVMSVSSDIFEKLSERGLYQLPIVNTPILSALFGGVLMGVGIGVIMRGGGSSGGSDIVIRVARIRHKHIKTGQFYLLSDAFIITASAFAFGNLEVALYAVVADVVCAFVLDKILYGTDEAKLLLVVSVRNEEIADRLMKEIDTGVTYLSGFGAYTGDGTKVLMCAIHKHHFTRAREIVREVDRDAFLIVSSASEVFGEGYKGHFSDDL